MIIGCPRSVKSTLGEKLYKKLNIPLYHLDLNNTNSKPIILELFSKYNNKNVYIFKNRSEADEFLSNL